MPTYDYACPKCGTTLEVFHGMNDSPRIRCPACRSLARKQFGTGAGLLFKGSGFYQTDYRSSSYQASAKADQSPAVASVSPTPPSASKSESKPVVAEKAKSA